MMDPLTRAYYEMAYKLAFHTKKADEFQDFFSAIMEKCYPGDFTRVRPWGNVGDKKNDGYVKSRRTLFQVYGPNELEAARTISKIDEDFNGALPHWQTHFDSWVFVHNSASGLGPDVLKKLLEMQTANPTLQVTSWGFEELRQETFALREPELASLLGAAPSHQGMVNLGLAELAPVLDQLSLAPANYDPDLRPVPADKLQKNCLSEHVAVLLTAGMSRADLVARYFRVQLTRQDQIAASFKAKYESLRDDGLAPDEVFAELQRFSGGSAVPSPARQNAVLAVLAYFFEACDIFERPESDGAPP